MTIDVELSEESLNEAIMAVQIYRDSLDQKTRIFVRDTAKVVEQSARAELSRRPETDETIATLRTRYRHNKYTESATLSVGGDAVWLEFGTGVVSNPVGVGGYAHPKAAQLGMYGIGEYGHGWGANPHGWFYYDESGEKHHTYGIPATMFMYHAAWAGRRGLTGIARRIFRT